MSLTEVLDKIESKDLAELDQQIAALTAQMDKLKGLRRIVVGILRAKDPQAVPRKSHHKRAAVATNGNGDAVPDKTERQAQVARFLLRVGTARTSRIAQECGIPLGSMARIMDSPLFEKNDDGYSLTLEAKRHFG